MKSNNLNPLITGLIQNAEANQTYDETDYIGRDGLLYCGKCHTPKQYNVNTTAEDGKKIRFTAPVLCQCRKAAMDAERLAAKQDIELGRAKIAAEELRNQSMMGDELKAASFENYEIRDGNREGYEIGRGYVDDFDIMLAKNQGLLFWGDTGLSKSYTAACIANALVEKGITAFMISVTTLTDTSLAFQRDEGELMRQMNRAKLLILDDLGVERDTPYAREKVYSVIENRLQVGMPMIVTTNLTMQQITNAQEMREKRVYERITKTCAPVRFTGKSFRQEEAVRRYAWMKEWREKKR